VQAARFTFRREIQSSRLLFDPYPSLVYLFCWNALMRTSKEQKPSCSTYRRRSISKRGEGRGGLHSFIPTVSCVCVCVCVCFGRAISLSVWPEAIDDGGRNDPNARRRRAWPAVHGVAHKCTRKRVIGHRFCCFAGVSFARGITAANIKDVAECVSMGQSGKSDPRRDRP